MSRFYFWIYRNSHHWSLPSFVNYFRRAILEILARTQYLFVVSVHCSYRDVADFNLLRYCQNA